MAALIALVIYMYGMLISITTREQNVCQMTYMFEYPQFVVSKSEAEMISRWRFGFFFVSIPNGLFLDMVTDRCTEIQRKEISEF